MKTDEAIIHAERVNIARQRFNEWYRTTYGKPNLSNVIQMRGMQALWCAWLAALNLNIHDKLK